jgi:hypothetical protein
MVINRIIRVITRVMSMIIVIARAVRVTTVITRNRVTKVITGFTRTVIVITRTIIELVW